MPENRFLIAPFNSGLVADTKPWLIPDEAFARLKNAYVYQGRVRKRFGTRLMSPSADVPQLASRLRVLLGTTNGSGNLSGTVPGTKFKVGQMFSIGTEMFTVNATGAPAVLLRTGATTTATYDTTNGAYVFAGADATTAVYFYPSDPVMALLTYETGSINDERVYAFDTQFAYQFTSGAWSRLGTATWTGGNSDFHWGYNYRGVDAYDTYLFVTNFVAADQIKYFDGSSWTSYNPIFNAAGDTIETARLVVGFKDRLVLLNTVEKISSTDQNFQARCRFSQNGDPTQATAGEEAFREDVPGKGGYIDAPTQEQIVTCQFLKDRLIVFFERSTWELVYTGNEILPFRWQQINTELGAESTFSQIPFDKVVLGVGNVGIHACNGANVERIDDKINDAVYDIHNGNDGVKRVYGIREYNTEMVYWSFPSSDVNPTFPNRVLGYNYLTGSWSFNDDSITCFGYYQKSDDSTWQDMTMTWEQANVPWTSGTLQSEYRDVIAGNQEGYVFIVDPDLGRNASALQITDATVSGSTVTLTVINNNLSISDYILIENVQGLTGLNGNIYQVQSTTAADTITITQAGVTGTYTGGGTIARVSQIDILTKQYNFFTPQGRNIYVSKVDFMVTKTSSGAFTVDYSPSSSSIFMVDQAQATGAILGTNVLETSPYATVPFEQMQVRLWHPIYLQSSGECIQLRLYLADQQMRNEAISTSNFEIHAMLFHASQTSYRLQ